MSKASNKRKQLKRLCFICTDASKTTEQWVNKVSSTEFEVYELPSDKMHSISLKDYSEEELQKEISGFYHSLEELRTQYGEDSNQIIAECISENLI